MVNGGVVFILGPVLDGSNILTSPLGKQRIHINQTLQNTARDSEPWLVSVRVDQQSTNHCLMWQTVAAPSTLGLRLVLVTTVTTEHQSLPHVADSCCS